MTARGFEFVHNSFRCCQLSGFGTGCHRVLPPHTSFLREWVRRNFSSENDYKIVGLASHLRYRENSFEQNVELSLRRADEVERILHQLAMAHFEEHSPAAITPNMQFMRFEVVGTGNQGILEDPDNANPEDHRAVQIMPRRRVLPPMVITARAPRNITAHSRFWIKYVSGMSGGVEYMLLMIKDPNNCWQRYVYGGPSFSPRFTPPSGSSQRRGQGWVRFTTNRPVYVNSFQGAAASVAASLQAGDTGVSYTGLEFGYGIGNSGAPNRSVRVSLPTGSGFGVGVSISPVSYLAAAGSIETGSLED